MPSADVGVHSNTIAQKISCEGIPVRQDVAFSDYKGEPNSRVRKREEKILKKLQPALQRVLLSGESVLYAFRCQSPLNAVEQLTAAWWTSYLAMCAIVITNQRILFFPVKRDGSWRESARAANWGDLAEVKCSGWLSKSATFKSRDGAKVTYMRLGRADCKKLKVIANALHPAAGGEQTPHQGIISLCPDCRSKLTPGVYYCDPCGLIFKNEKSMILRSIFLPGGGYFYTGHPLIAIIPAIVEVFLVFDIVMILVAGIGSPQAKAGIIALLIYFAVVWGLETGITILHCRRYVREFIPEKRDPVKSAAMAARGTG